MFLKINQFLRFSNCKIKCKFFYSNPTRNMDLHDDLSGMLRTKMNLLNRTRDTTRDDSQSRDSGHSSSGGTASNNSPALRHRTNNNHFVVPRRSTTADRFSPWFEDSITTSFQNQPFEESSVYRYLHYTGE